jgi:hypothetical protein
MDHGAALLSQFDWRFSRRSLCFCCGAVLIGTGLAFLCSQPIGKEFPRDLLH